MADSLAEDLWLTEEEHEALAEVPIASLSAVALLKLFQWEEYHNGSDELRKALSVVLEDPDSHSAFFVWGVYFDYCVKHANID